MSHRPASPALKRTARLIVHIRKGDDAATADRRAIADFLAVWQRDRCGRAPCARAFRCIAPGAPCIDRHRDTIRDTLHDLADRLDDRPEAAEEEEGW